MNKKQIEALVNKGAITHVGIAADLEKLSDKEICERYVTCHEVAAEVLEGANETPVEPTIKVPVTVNVTSIGDPVIGEIVTTKVSLNPGDYAGTMIRVRYSVAPVNATKLKYKEGDQWLDLPVEGSDNDTFYFGAPSGFPLTAGIESEFNTECLVAGDVTITLDILDVATGEVIGTGAQTVTIAEAPVEEVAPVALSEEPATEITTIKKTSKKAKKAAEEVTEAPVVDPVTE